MSAEQLQRLEAAHQDCDRTGLCPECWFKDPEWGLMNEPWPCLVSSLIAEIRRLQRENQLLHLSRGSVPAGMGLD